MVLVRHLYFALWAARYSCYQSVLAHFIWWCRLAFKFFASLTHIICICLLGIYFTFIWFTFWYLLFLIIRHSIITPALLPLCYYTLLPTIASDVSAALCIVRLSNWLFIYSFFSWPYNPKVIIDPLFPINGSFRTLPDCFKCICLWLNIVFFTFVLLYWVCTALVWPLLLMYMVCALYLHPSFSLFSGAH